MKALCTLLALIISSSIFSIPLQASGETEREDFPNFIENKGQWEDKILFQAEMFSASIFLEADRLTYLLMDDNDLHDLHHRHHHPEENWSEELLIDAHAFNVQFVGANPNATKRASCDLPTYRNYYIGSDSEKWASNVGLYRQIDYDNLYEDIDFRLYGAEGNVKYDFMVAPHADASQIRLFYEGTDNLFIKDDNLHIVTSVNTLIEQAPYAYQYIDGQEVAVDCHFKLLDGRFVIFDFPEGYDPSQELIIDPVVVFATYTGSTADNWGFTATFDPTGAMYSAGVAFGAGYPTTMGAFQMNFAGGNASSYRASDIGITKYSPDGSNLIFSTYIGGSIANEMPHSLIVSESGELVLYGTTGSSDYPTTSNAYDKTFGGGFSVVINSIAFPNGSDIIVTRFNSDGTALVGSTFVGGSQQDGLNTALNYNYADQGRGEVILDAQSNVYVASCTQSGDFPTSSNSLFPNYNGGAQDACIFKLNQDLSVLEWSTFLGGTNSDAAYSLKLAPDNTLYICGGTRSVDYPATIGSLQSNYSGGTHDGFITQIGNDGQSFLASTFLGTSAYDQSYFVELDEAQNVYTVGQTSGNYPIENAGFVNVGGGHYIHKLTSDLSTTIFSTRFGRGDGDPDISPTAFLVDTCGQIYVAGWGGNTNGASPANSTTNGLTVSPDAFQSTTDGSDFYLMVLAENASALNYATFFGGAGDNEHVDGGTSRFDKNGVVYEAVCASCGSSNNFPTTPGVWSNTNNSDNCNLGSFKFALTGPEVLFDVDPNIDCENPLNISFVNNSVNASSYIWDFGDNTTSMETSPTHIYAEPGVYEVTLIAIGDDGCTVTDTSAQITNVFDLPVIELVGEGTCLNDGTDNFSIDINFSGGSNTTYTLGGAASGTIATGTTIGLTLLGGDDYTITAVDNTTGCAGELTFTGPVCPDCEPDAGTMQASDLQIVCSDGTVSSTTTGEILEEGQVLTYILHTNADTTAGIVLAMNTTGTFGFPANGSYYTTYYISAVVGFADIEGNLDFEDDCTVVAAGSPVLFLAPVELLVDEFCDLQTGDFYVTAQVTGGYPQYDNNAVYTITGDFADELEFMETFTLVFAENGQNIYEINVISDGFGCNGVNFTSEQFACEKNPIELLNFEGEATVNGNSLQWVTLTESNNDRFVVERSDDGKNFVIIGEVKGVGNSQFAITYKYLDRTVGCGVHYYRFVQYDNNGLSSVSPTIAVTRGEASGNASVVVSPVPSQDFIEVTFYSSANTANLTLFDTKGQVVLQQSLESENCNKKVQLDINKLVAGVYLLQINSGDKVLAQRLVKY
ncbi:MAG: PKD domain-containing protein [Chitinophagales bacterium]